MSIPADLLSAPVVVQSTACATCGRQLDSVEREARIRDASLAILAAETETFDRPEHGDVWMLPLDPFPGCAHVAFVPLPVWRASWGGFYYGRSKRELAG